MILYKEEDNNNNINEPVKNINLIYIIKQLMTILNILRVKQVLLKEIQDSNCIDYYNPKNLVLNNAINITFNRKGMKLHVTNKEMDEMIYVGFESMTKYIEERNSKYIYDNKKRADAILNF
jgi:hypothetical protein